jgi:predicted alpha/beta hydrolase
VSATPSTEPSFALTRDGVRLAFTHRPARVAPGERPRGAVVLGHAFMASRRSLDRPAENGLASELAAAGLEAYAFDFRGHGGSKGALDSATKAVLNSAGWNYANIVDLDIPAMVAFVRSRHPALRVGLVGHSLAGHGVLAWLGTDPHARLRAVVTIAANIWLRELEPSRALWLEKRATVEAAGALAAACGRIPARALRLGSEDAPAAFIADLRRWARAGRWTGPRGEDYLASLARVEGDVLAVFGAGDRLLCRPLSGELFHRHLRSARVEMHVAGAADLGFDPGHMELVTDPRARPLWRRIAGWLAARLGG